MNSSIVRVAGGGAGEFGGLVKPFADSPLAWVITAREYLSSKPPMSLMCWRPLYAVVHNALGTPLVAFSMSLTPCQLADLAADMMLRRRVEMGKGARGFTPHFAQLAARPVSVMSLATPLDSARVLFHL